METAVKITEGIQCRECEGFRHIQAECANTLKKNKKSHVVSWSDDDSDSSKKEDESLTIFLLSVL